MKLMLNWATNVSCARSRFLINIIRILKGLLTRQNASCARSSLQMSSSHWWGTWRGRCIMYKKPVPYKDHPHTVETRRDKCIICKKPVPYKRHPHTEDTRDAANVSCVRSRFFINFFCALKRHVARNVSCARSWFLINIIRTLKRHVLCFLISCLSIQVVCLYLALFIIMLLPFRFMKIF